MMATMEEQLEKEKMDIKKKYDKEKKRIQQQAEITEDAKQRLLEELKTKEAA